MAWSPDARVVDLENAAGLVAYVPSWILPRRQTTLVVRTETGPLTLVAADIEAVAAIDPAVPIHNIRTMDRLLSAAVAARRFQLTLTIGFALAGLSLVGLGVYGVAVSAVERRRTRSRSVWPSAPPPGGCSAWRSGKGCAP